MRIPILEYPGFEADDVIGTIARRAEAAGLRRGDRLERQGHAAARHRPRLHAQPGQGRRLVRPGQGQGIHGRHARDQVADLLALKGDAIDNIPGAPGIGEKGAQDLIEQFGSVDAALERAAEVERKTYRESLQNNVERIRMSKRLATIATDVPIEFSLESVKAQAADAAAAEGRLQGAGVPQPAQGTRARRGHAARAITASSPARRNCTRGWRQFRPAQPRRGRDFEIRRGRVRARHHRPGLAARRGARRHGREPAAT